MTKLQFLFSGVFICVLVAFISCEKKVGKIAPKVSVVVCDSIKFTKHIQPIILKNCAIPTCHVAGGTGPSDFSTYAGVSTKSALFKARVIDATPTSMPPATNGGQLPKGQLDSIQCWLDHGAPND